MRFIGPLTQWRTNQLVVQHLTHDEWREVLFWRQISTQICDLVKAGLVDESALGKLPYSFWPIKIDPSIWDGQPNATLQESLAALNKLSKKLSESLESKLFCLVKCLHERKQTDSGPVQTRNV